MASVYSIASLAQHVRLNLVRLEYLFAACLELNCIIKCGNLFIHLIISTFELFFYWVSHFEYSTNIHLTKHSSIKGNCQSSHVLVKEVSYSCSAHFSQRLYLVDLDLGTELCIHLLKEQIGAAEC